LPNTLRSRITSTCKRCGTAEHLEKHHIRPKSEGGSNKKENLKSLCTACHDYEHAKRNVLKQISYYEKRLSLMRYRLDVIEKLNSVELVKEFGYRTYWVDEETHGDRKKTKYRRKKNGRVHRGF
jgi:hypothetical protein